MQSYARRLALMIMLTMQTLPVAAQRSINGDNRLQAYFGVMEFEDQTGSLQNDEGDPVEINFANLINLGIDAETPMNGPDTGLEWGVNAGASLGWRGGDTSYAGSVGGGGANVTFRVDNDMLLVEGHIGPYLRTHLGSKVDVYLGAGPAIIYAEVDADGDGEEGDGEPVTGSNGSVILGDSGDSDVVIGLHARAGIEFDLGAGRQWGLGLKYLRGELDFNDTVGEFDIEGYSLLITYSAWY
ncbi:MAG: hypothetical protein AAGI24_03075 [Pseudomonadota bacterium]